MSSATTDRRGRERLHTIGAVCDLLRDEFPDISISKIRYLEDQGLLSPQRTRGGYRLFSDGDVERLVTILRLQRDEFLPLKVIKQELQAGAVERHRRRPSLVEEEIEIDLAELCARAGVEPDLARDLEEFDLLAPRLESGVRWYRESDVEVVSACARLAAFGVAPRNLRLFRTGASRQAALLEQLFAPALRSGNPERRRAALEDMEGLVGVAQELSRLLVRRDLREFLGR